jgi:hypothetical protein
VSNYLFQTSVSNILVDMRALLTNADELRAIFALSEKYIEYTPLTDYQVGFSVKREYPAGIRYIPPKNRNKASDSVALFHVLYAHPDYSKSNKDRVKIPIYIFVSTYSRYLANHDDYYYDDDNSPTKESLGISKSSPKPIDLESKDEYSFDNETDSLVDIDGEQISGESILERLFEQHCSTVKLLNSLRIRMQFRDKLVVLCDLSLLLIKKLLALSLGRTFDPKETLSGILKPYDWEDMKLLNTETVDLLGYKAPKNLIITFSSLILLAYVWFSIFSIKSIFLSHMISNNFLVVCFVICSLFLLDWGVPLLLFYAINRIIDIKTDLLFRKFKA